eukprot:15098848-Heterocapsa_arctica.AAC.1
MNRKRRYHFKVLTQGKHHKVDRKQQKTRHAKRQRNPTTMSLATLRPVRIMLAPIDVREQDCARSACQ